MKPLAVLLFLEPGTRRVHRAGITAHPPGDGVTPQARNLLMNLEGHVAGLQFFIRDRDAKCTRGSRRGIRCGRREDHHDTGAGAAGERDRGTRDRPRPPRSAWTGCWSPASGTCR